MRLYITALLSLFLVVSVIALAAAVSRDSRAANEAATRIEVDEQANVIRFFIDGDQKAVLDAEGLHVREGIRYGHDIIDYGGSGFDERFGEGANAE